MIQEEIREIAGLDDDVRNELEAFLMIESELLDDRRYREWLELLTDEIRYTIPTVEVIEGEHEEQETLLQDDNLFRIKKRIERLETGRAWAEIPPTQTRHLISNVRIRSNGLRNGYDVKSNFLLHFSRREEINNISGERQDLIKQTKNDQWKLDKRYIQIDQNRITANSLSFFI